jgi:VWFA-related protein
MKTFFFKIFANSVIAFILFFGGLQFVWAQSECLNGEAIQQIINRLETSPQTARNKKLQDEVLNMKENVIDRFADKSRQKARANILTSGVFKMESRIETRENAVEKKKDKYDDRICEIFNQHGWLTKSLVGEEGVAAWFYLLKNFTSFEFQLKIVPVIAAAVRKNELAKNEDFASFLDRLRLRAGLKQLFGTQAVENNGFLVLAPIQSTEKIDEWRNQYKMPPLNNYLKFLEMTYQMPVVRALTSEPPALKKESNRHAFSLTERKTQSDLFAGNSENDADIIRVESNLVNLNLRVLNKDLKNNIGSFEQTDFKVFENQREEKIIFFAKTETPFDLVLLLDLSGSTVDKQDLIKKTAQRFVRAARPSDRIAIVTFTHKIKVITPLTEDRERVFKSIEKIGDIGHSHVWDAVKFTLENVLNEKTANRRRAVVMMSDGVDNALNYAPVPFGSRISFAELAEAVRNSDALFIPIYLDTENQNPCVIGNGYPCNAYQKIYRQARDTLSFLAEESGGQMYRARKLEDLNAVYDSVLNDLSAVYSLGYVPINEKRDGSWRTVKVEINEKPDLIVRTKIGYYAK